MLVPTGFFPPCFPVTYTIWLPATSTEHTLEASASSQQHQVLKPKPGFAKERTNMDELVGMSQLSIGMETRHEAETSHSPSPLSLKLIGEPSRPSAFHSNGSVSGSGLSKGSSAIQATWKKSCWWFKKRRGKVLTGLNQRLFLVLGGNKPRRHKPLETKITCKENITKL